MALAPVQDLRIADFSPNCLMGTGEAIARARLGIDSFDRLFFNHSFVYDRHPDGLGFDSAPVLNSSFSRALPLDKAAFLDRMAWCYGLEFAHKGYDDFATLKADLDRLGAARLPVISEIDFHVFAGHPFCGKRHEGHMMIVRGPGAHPGTYAVVDAVFGHSDFPVRALASCFAERRARGRPFYLIHLRRVADHDRLLPREQVLADLSGSLANLSSPEPHLGLRGLAAFAGDLSTWLPGAPGLGIVPGFWAFMCNARNNLRFLAALDSGLRAVAGPQISALEADFGWLYKRWFVLNLTMESAVAEPPAPAGGGAKAEAARLLDGLRDVVSREAGVPARIAALIGALEAA